MNKKTTLLATKAIISFMATMFIMIGINQIDSGELQALSELATGIPLLSNIMATWAIMYLIILGICLYYLITSVVTLIETYKHKEKNI